MVIADKISKDLNTLAVLNKLWEKSFDKEKSKNEIEEFVKVNFNIINDILNIIIPEYKRLLDKDELTAEEEWLLIYSNNIFNYIIYLLSNLKSITSLYLSLKSNDELDNIFKNINDTYLYLLDLTGLRPKKDVDIENQIKMSLKDKSESKVRNIDDLLKELDV